MINKELNFASADSFAVFFYLKRAYFRISFKKPFLNMVITCSGGVGFCNILHPLKHRQDLFTGFFGFALADIVFHIHIGKTFMAVNRMIRLPDLSANRSEAGIVIASCLEFIVFFNI